MTDLARCLAEQAECASYLTDPAKLAAWCAKYGATEEQGRNGAMQGAEDWLMEETILRTDKQRDKRAEYEAFLRSKVIGASLDGIEIDPSEVNPMLKPHQRDIVLWAVRGGRRAIFAAFGLGKTFMQLEIARLITKHAGGRFLIVCPLGVRQEFMRDAGTLGITVAFIRRIEEAGPVGIYLTNYETIREGKLDPRQFIGTSLDEAAVLRGFGGTKTFREFMTIFEGSGIRFRFVATATPAPNDYIELLAYAGFLEVMDIGQAKTRFFKRNSEKADQLTIHPHKQREFWLWCASWAIFLQRPSDLGYDDAGYELPDMDVHWHELPTDHSNAGYEVSGQGRLVKSTSTGVVEASREKRDSLQPRIEKMMELRALDPAAHRVIWHDLEAERHAIKKADPAIATVYGSQDLDEREDIVADFSDGRISELAAKPVMLGSGCNLQRYCAWAIYLGIGFKFNEFFQSLHRIQRFLQTRRVRIDLIYTEAEREVRRILEQKWAQHIEMMGEMSTIIREYGLAEAALASTLQRSIGVERQDVSGKSWRLINNDAVLETMTMPDNSQHLILTSIPFSTQYEYTPSYNDFGHTDSNSHFWKQMDFLTPELLRILKPGRIASVHVKDRIIPGGINKLGFQTVYPFHCDAIAHFTKHGFAYLGMRTITTDVVRENNQTYRLGWTEQCKDGTKMGHGMPEYLLTFRKPPTDATNSYADEPVVKDKGKYSRSRWQIDAHAYARSDGNRLIAPEELDDLTHAQIFQLFKKVTAENVYNYENHVALAESLERCPECKHIHIGQRRCANGSCKCTKAGGRLPVTFMLLQPSSWSDEVWTDVTRMLGMNTLQHAAGREGHLCPMQFDIADRVITQYTEPGEIVFDPFVGLGTVPYRAVLLGRRGLGVELNTRYWADGTIYCEAAERKAETPGLFDLVAMEECA